MPLTTRYDPENRVSPAKVGMAIHWSRNRSDQELDALDKMERAHHASVPDLNLRQLMEVYPTAKAAAMRGSRARIKEVKRGLSGLTQVREAWSEAINKMKPKQQPAFIDWLDGHIAEKEHVLETELKRYAFGLSYLKNLGREEEAVSTTGITDEQIAHAKETPISSLVKVNRAHKALCVWHNESNPSMHCYKEHVYCFSCQKAGDAIDVFMVLNGCTFVEAVKRMV